MTGRVSTRHRVLGKVRSFPGLHVRALGRELDMPVSLVEYHVRGLLNEGLIADDRDDGYQRLFSTEAEHRPSKEARRWLGLLRQRVPVRIVLAMLDAGTALRHGDLVDLVGVGKSTLTFHLRKLQSAGLVEKQEDQSFRLRRAAEVEKVLLAHGPTPAMRDRFADVWLGFYDDAP